MEVISRISVDMKKPFFSILHARDSIHFTHFNEYQEYEDKLIFLAIKRFMKIMRLHIDGMPYKNDSYLSCLVRGRSPLMLSKKNF